MQFSGGEVFQVIDTLALLVFGFIGWLLARAVTRLYQTIDRAVDRLDDHEKRLSHLEGVANGFSWKTK
jgi:hypothetical protein